MELSKQDVAGKLGIKPTTVDSWVRAGCPHDKRKEGTKHKKCFFEVVALAEWLASTGKPKHVFRLRDVLPEPEGSEFEGTRERVAILDMAETVTQESYHRYKNAGDSEKVFLQEQWERAADVQRKLQKDWAGIQMALGAVMPVSEHERLWIEGHGRVAMEWKMTDKRLAKKVMKCKSLPEVLTAIEANRIECMRHIAVELAKFDKEVE